MLVTRFVWARIRPDSPAMFPEVPLSWLPHNISWFCYPWPCSTPPATGSWSSLCSSSGPCVALAADPVLRSCRISRHWFIVSHCYAELCWGRHCLLCRFVHATDSLYIIPKFSSAQYCICMHLCMHMDRVASRLTSTFQYLIREKLNTPTQQAQSRAWSSWWILCCCTSHYHVRSLLVIWSVSSFCNCVDIACYMFNLYV